MFRFFKNRKQTPEYSDPINPETLAQLEAELQQVRDMLGVISESFTRSFAQKVAGNKHDGQHNIDSDNMSMTEQRCKKREADLTARIRRIQNGLGITAL